ncbi:hypothetical protein TNCV_4385111 [Trichonephila clavipes]|nr:hypothetical protein TNCV_4385111 [Trichonephila clavipes]
MRSAIQSRAVVRTYPVHFSDRRMPDHRIFQRLTRVTRLGCDRLSIVDQSLNHPDLPIYEDIRRILFIRLHLIQMRISLLEYPKLLHMGVSS